MRPRSRAATPTQYQPPAQWEATARYFEEIVSDPQAMTSAITEGVTRDRDGRLRTDWRLPAEAVARVLASAKLLEISSAQVLERAIASQWSIDKHMASGLRQLWLAEGHLRRELRLPLVASPPRPQ